MTEFELFGPVDSVLGSTLVADVLVVEVLLLALVLANMAARARAHFSHVSEVEQARSTDDAEADEAISRHPARVLTNLLLVLGAFYYTTLSYHAGMVVSVLLIGVVLTDVFEFESRKVEARRDVELDPPKAAVAGSLLALVYLVYVTLFSGPIGQFV
jgi:hypothetical protein